MRIGILASHPIQYQTPLFAQLAEQADVQVFFAERIAASDQAAAGFGVCFQWDRPLLDGYPYQFLVNRAARPSVLHYHGCDTPEIERLIGEGAFDVFVVNGWFLKSFWQAIAACQRHGVPVAAWGDSVLPESESLLRRWARQWALPRRLRHFDAFLSVGQRNRQYLRHFGVADHRIHYVPHHVDVAWIRQQIADGPPKRAPGDELRLLFVGKLIELKRVEDLIEAAALLGARGVRAKVIIAGSGPCQKALERLAAARRVQAEFLGFKNQTELPRIYRDADLLVLPSRSETWGLVVNEAFACGTAAIVSTAVGCGPDMIRPGITGDTFAVGDPASLAAAVLRLRPVLGLDRSLAEIAASAEAHCVQAAAQHYLRAVQRIARTAFAADRSEAAGQPAASPQEAT